MLDAGCCTVCMLLHTGKWMESSRLEARGTHARCVASGRQTPLSAPAEPHSKMIAKEALGAAKEKSVLYSLTIILEAQASRKSSQSSKKKSN